MRTLRVVGVAIGLMLIVPVTMMTAGGLVWLMKNRPAYGLGIVAALLFGFCLWSADRILSAWEQDH